MQGADQHIGAVLRFSILPKDTMTCRPGESKQATLRWRDAGSTPESQPPDNVSIIDQSLD